ncbi:hypothetical protein [Sorangium sp. So ce1000]
MRLRSGAALARAELSPAHGNRISIEAPPPHGMVVGVASRPDSIRRGL